MLRADEVIQRVELSSLQRTKFRYHNGRATPTGAQR